MSAFYAELQELQQLVESLPRHVQVEQLCQIQVGPSSLPVYAIDLAPHLDPSAPVLAYFGGVHGLEVIGSKILLSHLSSLCVALSWDSHLANLLERLRVVLVPIVNPAGVLLRSRSNQNGVDLMRNAPIESDELRSRFWLFRGHRFSRRLPWYRGELSAPMEIEAQAVCDFVRKVLFPSRFSLALDVHSGFMGQDRIWFPYARTRRLFPDAAEVLALKEVLDATYPSHRYIIEPQSVHYTTHGDLWDYLYDEHRQQERAGLFLPLTLELSSSAWLRNRPTQIFSRRGMFHPSRQHEVVRLLRRHAHFLELMMRLVDSHDKWLPTQGLRRTQLAERAIAIWGA
jgi:hypothetical protein